MPIVKIDKLVPASDFMPCADERDRIELALRKEMRSIKGCGGLCGPQIGIDARVMIIKCKKPPHFNSATLRVMWWPKITEYSSTKVVGEENNYSFGKKGKVYRSTSIILKYDGYTEEEFGGTEARVIQHMVDMLNGIPFTDKLAGGV